MGIWTRLRAAGGALISKSAGAAALPAAGYLPTLGSTPSATGLLISQGTAMAVSAVYGCVTIRSQDVARCTPRLFRRRPDGSREQVRDHPVAKLFQRPNRVQTWFEFMEQMQAAYLLRGNAYAAILRDGRGKPAELIPINPDAVLVLESFDGQVFYNVNRIGLWQTAMLRDFPSSIAAEDILHLRGLSFNALVALSTIGMARDAIGVAMGLEQQTARMQANGSRPSGVLQAKKTLSEAVAGRLKQQWREVTSGIHTTGATPILEDGIEWKSLALTSVDQQFMEQRKFQVDDVCRFYRMPPFKLGMTELRGVNIEQIQQDYVNGAVMPDLDRWEAKIEADFGLHEEGLEVDMDETRLLRADITSRYTAARIALGGGAFVSVNEVRAGEDLAPMPGGDVVTRPLNVAALGSDITGTAPDGAGHPSANEGGVPGADNVSPAASPGSADGADKGAVDLMTRLGLPDGESPTPARSP